MALVPNLMFEWNIITVIVCTSIIVMLYSLMGGIRAVVWTDAIQAIVLIGGAIITVFVICLKMPGGFSGIIQTGMDQDKFLLGSFSLELTQPTFWVVLVYGTFINLQNFGIDQNYIQRYMTSKSLSDAQNSAFWGALLYVPVSMLFLFIGSALFSIYHTGIIALPESFQNVSQADKIFPYFIANEMPAGITGLLLASIFAAGMSTISTSYNSSATIILTDFFEKFSYNELSENKKLAVLYISTAAISVLGMIVGIAMINAKSALDTWWKMASIFSGGVLGLFLLSAFTKIQNRLSAIIGVSVGLLIIVWMTVTSLASDKIPVVHPYLTIVFGTSAIFIVGTLLGSVLERASKKNKNHE
jgi:SSS family solute:Na+ symporter